MPYLDQDVALLVTRSPYLTLAKPDSAARYLACRVEWGTECARALAEYPGLRIEPLEFFYTCLRSLGPLDVDLLTALVRDLTWRGVVWGSFLALLDPRDEFVAPLRAAIPAAARQRWLLEGAIARIEGRAPDPAHAQVFALAEQCRRLLAGVPRPSVPLRRAPTATELEQMAREREHVRRRYLDGGAGAAREAMRGTVAEYYTQDYTRWVRAGAHGPPTITR